MADTDQPTMVRIRERGVMLPGDLLHDVRIRAGREGTTVGRTLVNLLHYGLGHMPAGWSLRHRD